MRTLSLFVVGLFFLGSIFCVNYATGQLTEKSINDYIIAYYFHGTFRCPTCHKLKQYSKEAIEINFKDALASGKLELKVINVEDKGNEHYASDYQLYTLRPLNLRPLGCG